MYKIIITLEEQIISIEYKVNDGFGQAGYGDQAFGDSEEVSSST